MCIECKCSNLIFIPVKQTDKGKIPSYYYCTKYDERVSNFIDLNSNPIHLRGYMDWIEYPIYVNKSNKCKV